MKFLLLILTALMVLSCGMRKERDKDTYVSEKETSVYEKECELQDYPTNPDCGGRVNRTKVIVNNNVDSNTDGYNQQPCRDPIVNNPQCPQCPECPQCPVQQVKEVQFLCFPSCAGNRHCMEDRGFDSRPMKTVTDRWGRNYECFEMPL